jgi:hypothetical protein
MELPNLAESLNVIVETETEKNYYDE